jgi:hypothetical protein
VTLKYTVKVPDPEAEQTKSYTATSDFHNLPIPLGPKSNRPEATTATLSKGTGETRQLAGMLGQQGSRTDGLLQEIGAMLKEAGVGDPEERLKPVAAELHQLENDSRDGMLAVQQLTEVAVGGRTGLGEIHPSIRKLTQLDEHVPTPQKKPRHKPTQKRVSDTSPIVAPISVSDKEVHQRTGFRSLLLMLFYISIVCNGNVELMMATSTTLTWFEEWFFFFEMIWGRSVQRWIDAERIFKLEKKRLRYVFVCKLVLVKKAVALWPRYAYHEEDVQLQSAKWKERYKGKRPIMWDNTNLDFLGKPTDADLQRFTYSLYYAGNVAKGAVFLQLCGWLGAWELWLGAISDSDYQERSGILQFQDGFQQRDPTTSEQLCFTNIMDKGYRCVQAAWAAGGQLLLQPFFARGDRKFTSREVLLSGAVASDRSGNERAVNRLKSSWMLSRGIHQKQDLDIFANLWIGFGFQCNFMYKPVL